MNRSLPTPPPQAWRLDHLPPDTPPPDEDAPPGHDRPQDDGPIHPAPDEIRSGFQVAACPGAPSVPSDRGAARS